MASQDTVPKARQDQYQFQDQHQYHHQPQHETTHTDKMGATVYERVLQTFNTILLAGVVIILALMLVEFQRMTDRYNGVVVRLDDTIFTVALSEGIYGLGSTSNPMHFIVDE